MVLQMNQNRLDKYSKTNEKIVPWALFIIFLISIPILYILSIEKVRFDITAPADLFGQSAGVIRTVLK